MNSIVDDLEELVSSFYEDNDDAHGLPHVREVARNTIAICNHRDAPFIVRRLSVMAAYIHDIFTNMRDHHHHKSADWVLAHTLMLQKVFMIRHVDVQVVSDACREHRASYEGEYSSIVSEIVSAADRGSPSDLKKLLIRSKVFAMSHKGMAEDIAKAHALEHMHEKFGRNGYAKYNDVYKDFYGKELEQLWLKIDKIVIDGSILPTIEFDRQLSLP